MEKIREVGIPGTLRASTPAWLRAEMEAESARLKAASGADAYNAILLESRYGRLVRRRKR